jgi:hypothetical protein
MDLKEEGKGNRFVAMIDILGFKNLISNKSIDKVYEMLYALQSHSEYPGPTSIFLKRNNRRISINVKLRSRVFSDTIFIWTAPIKLTNSNAPIFLQTLAESVSELILWSLINMIPLRGGISYGSTYISKQGEIIVGQAIIDAYMVESQQQWIGAALHPSCPTFGLENQIEMCLKKYHIPIKNTEIVKPIIAIDWSKPCVDPLNWYSIVSQRKSKIPPHQIPKDELKTSTLRLTRKIVLKRIETLKNLAKSNYDKEKYENARTFVLNQSDGMNGSPLDISRSFCMDVIIPQILKGTNT